MVMEKLTSEKVLTSTEFILVNYFYLKGDHYFGKFTIKFNIPQITQFDNQN